ncbi:putative vacuole-associated enzyme activator complex component [Tricharina praecox]|uniref:putative vacuole-associated enzyme activator complex component n=1 Tax=Tricharina praecox TaxID=43433 RepID=UPI00221E71FB|nr:putative vacuole-associated enzyme activator complex component [Tricharina praecox]KAI5855409.1 putative vacuole-associated enzyme activator complex component [Tricharina praecox]
MDPSIQRSLNDKLYDRRKLGALDLEKTVRECLAHGDHGKVHTIIEQLCHDYAYAVHQPHARNGGLIGLAAASIALGSEVARYLDQIVPPVLACFADQDARVRYYACESMYNIAKVAKGEILPFFNEVFDALSKLAADPELSVKNGAELLDRLVKDIVAESAASYISVLQASSPEESLVETEQDDNSPTYADDEAFPTAFSLPRFIPLLKERIHVINPFTRIFLVSWITLLDSIPDLELVTHLPAFLGGLFRFLSDPNQDVHVATQQALEGFLAEIKRIARVKRGVEESRKNRAQGHSRTLSDDGSTCTDEALRQTEKLSLEDDRSNTATPMDEKEDGADGSWIPGQDVEVDHHKILEILVPLLDALEEEIQLTALRWVDNFFDICPEDLLPFVPRLLSHVLPAIAHPTELVRHAATKVNTSLLNLILSLAEDSPSQAAPAAIPTLTRLANKEAASEQQQQRRDSHPRQSLSKEADLGRRTPTISTPTPGTATPPITKAGELDYAATVSALTLQFLNEHEQTRVVALEWLLMLHRKAPRKMLAINDGTFPALLKTLSDPSEQVVTRDLQLLSQISHNSEDDYFASFMHSLLSLFSTDRRLLETRGNLIIRHLCVNLNPERIYRTLADILEKDEDVEFASIMVQNLNNNLITAPELAELRKRLRSLDTKDGQTFFVTLFRSWCHNAVAAFSLCLLAQAYEQASNLLHTFAELEITVNLLIQVDKLVHLLESPVFTYLRLQLLEPDKYPYLYKCLYGLLMLLPQSSAFGTLKNRLNSVSAIGYLNGPPRAPAPSTTPYERPTRLKGRADDIKWMELLEKFKAVQQRQQAQYSIKGSNNSNVSLANSASTAAGSLVGISRLAAGRRVRR